MKMELVGVLNVIGGMDMKSKQDLIYRIIRKNVVSSMRCYVDDSDYIDEIVDYIISVTKLDELVEAIRYIAFSKMWDSDNLYCVEDNVGKYWQEKATLLANKAEDAILAIYREVV